jgi:hypothetical protein
MVRLGKSRRNTMTASLPLLQRQELRRSSRPRSRAQTTFIITFAPCVGIDDARALRGLRRTLKFALRGCGLRCIACEEILPAHPADAPAPSAFSAPFHDGD